MAKMSSINKNNKRLKLSNKFYKKRRELKKIVMNKNLKLVVNNSFKKIENKNFFEKKELKTILDLYAKMVSEGSWKDYGLSIANGQVGFSVFKNAAENAMYKICKNFNPSNKYLRYLITDTNGKILKNSNKLKSLLNSTDWKKLKK